jgi:hypothetical protein
MQRVERIYTVILADDDHYTFADCDKLRLGHGKSPPVGHVDGKGLESIRDLFPNPLDVHTHPLACPCRHVNVVRNSGLIAQLWRAARGHSCPQQHSSRELAGVWELLRTRMSARRRFHPPSLTAHILEATLAIK